MPLSPLSCTPFPFMSSNTTPLIVAGANVGGRVAVLVEVFVAVLAGVAVAEDVMVGVKV